MSTLIVKEGLLTLLFKSVGSQFVTVNADLLSHSASKSYLCRALEALKGTSIEGYLFHIVNLDTKDFTSLVSRKNVTVAMPRKMAPATVAPAVQVRKVLAQFRGGKLN